MTMTCTILLLATVASAQYAITDLLGNDAKDGSDSSSPASQQVTGPVSSPLPAATGPQVGVNAANPMGIQEAPGTNAGNPMQSLLSGVAQMATSPSNTGNTANPMAALLAGEAGPSAQSQDPLSAPALSQDSMAVVSGLVEAFMHKSQLQPGESECLKNNMGTLAGDVMGTVGDIVTAVKAVVAGNGNVQPDASPSIASAGMDGFMKISSLAASTTQLIKNCVHGDTLVMLNETAHHLINGKYLEHRFLVNGIDIARGLSDSVVAFESNDFHRFGTDIGFSLRKILLSNATKGTRLPEGEPEEDIIQKATDGLMKGFFVSGSALKITDSVHPNVDIVINLHKCVAGNSQFFKQLWMGVWDLISKFAVDAEQHDLGELFNHQGGGQPKWAGEFMMAMMEFPMALTKCGVDADMQAMFMEAIQTLNDVRVQIKVPDDHFKAVNTAQRAEETSKRMAEAVEYFTKWNFEGFGYEIGMMLRELVMLAFPQQYSFDASGRLQRYSKTKTVESEGSASISATSAIIGGAVISMLFARFAIVAVRGHGSSSSISADTDMTDNLDIEVDGPGAE